MIKITIYYSYFIIIFKRNCRVIIIFIQILEISMEIWDLENTNSEIKNVEVKNVEVKNVEIKNVEKPKQPTKITLSVTNDKSPAVTVQASRKRKRCTSQNYIDQYFKPKKKEENLNTDLENGSKNNPL